MSRRWLVSTANTRLSVTAERPVPDGGAILSARIGRLPQRQANSRENPFGAPVRESSAG